MDEHERSYDGSAETFDDAKDRARKTLRKLSHDIVNLFVEYAEEKWSLTNEKKTFLGISYNPRQLVGKALFWASVVGFIAAFFILGAVVYGIWDI